MENISLHTQGIPRNYSIDRFEKECPQCHKGIHVSSANILGWNYIWEKSFEIFFKCPQCKKAFISGYYFSESQREYLFQKSYPQIPEEIKISEELEQFTDQFCEIYKQADTAEKYNLNQIAGVGYRKALEFLVKDYLIKIKKIDKSEIEAKFLKNCIEKMDNPRIKSASERASWLGNDETHYQRRWENKDISDLKKLLDITMQYITSEIMLDNYEKTMPKS